MNKPFARMEFARPDELEAILDAAPVAYVPLGTFEHHGFHLPVCFDGIKAHALCLRAAAVTGGAVLPPFFYGTGGGHLGFKWTIMPDAERIEPLLAETLDALADFGFKAVVVLTGHYPGEQIALAKRLAEGAAARNPGVKYLGVPEHVFNTPDGDDRFPGDHAAKYETSLALALDPSWVRLDLLHEGRDPERLALPQTPRTGGTMFDTGHALYGIAGQDPRVHASAALGERLVAQIVDGLAAWIAHPL